MPRPTQWRWVASVAAVVGLTTAGYAYFDANGAATPTPTRDRRRHASSTRTDVAPRPTVEPAPPERPVTVLSNPANPAVERLLDAGDAHFDAGQWSLPAGDNAFDKYRAALRLEPANPRAAAGVAQVCDGYVRRAEEVLAAGDSDGARWRYQRVVEILAEPDVDAALSDAADRAAAIANKLAEL